MQIREFNNIVDKLKDKMFGVALRIVRNREEARDVVQDALVKVWNKWEHLKTVDNKDAYIMTITRNMAIDLVRSRKMETSELDNHFDLKSDSANPERIAVAKDIYANVRAFIDNMPENHRAVLELRDIDGYSYKEISEITGYSLEKVKVYLFRARLKIKEHFKTQVL